MDKSKVDKTLGGVLSILDFLIDAIGGSAQ